MKATELRKATAKALDESIRWGNLSHHLKEADREGLAILAESVSCLLASFVRAANKELE